MPDKQLSTSHGTKPSTVHLAESSEQIAEHARTVLCRSSGKLILVPVDFSDYSKAALLQAAEFAEMMSATLVVLHVVHDPGDMPGYYSNLIKNKRVAQLQDLAAEAFSNFLARIIEAHPDRVVIREAERLLVIGIPVTRILEVVEKLQPAVVVMGSQGRTGLEHALLGSKAERVVQLCPVPVTIVKSKK
jgi:nucleotide-binding universal stress UspA family protein